MCTNSQESTSKSTESFKSAKHSTSNRESRSEATQNSTPEQDGKVSNGKRTSKNKHKQQTKTDMGSTSSLDLSIIKKPINLAKVIKKLSKASHKDKKHILNTLSVERLESGDLVLRAD